MTPRADFQFDAFIGADEIIVDSFAGGGGASLGIQWALGRGPHIAINHDKEAIALHAANHPESEHFPEDVWHVDPVEACAGRKVGLMWLSPDCKHFSKAKGGKPVSKKIRGLAWTAVRWAAAVKPRVIILENVEEFKTWGPVLYGTNKPCPRRKGQTFRAFVRKLERLGYVVETRDLRACDFGAPTTRRRLFLIARCDGRAIVWPTPTHGKGTPNPWRTAAECIDWSLPCPSIFLTREESTALRKATGLRTIRPLAVPTLRRIARGIQRFVIECPEPFIVGVGGRMDQTLERSVLDPMNTLTGKPDSAVVVPHITKFRPNSTGSAMDQPMPTVTANSFVKRPGGASPLGVIAPHLVAYHADHPGEDRARGSDMRNPLPTQDTSNRFGLVVPSLVQTGYGEREGQAPRSLNLQQPLGTVVADAKHALVNAFLSKYYGDTNQRPGSEMREPVDTITSADHNALVSSHLLKLHGTSQQGQLFDEPAPTIRAGGNHLAEVRAFLVAYYGNEKDGQSMRSPLRTVTAKDRVGVVTIHGADYVIVDIGLRMLNPRERFRAQGFPDSYIIDVPYDYEMKRSRKGKKITVIVRKTLTQEAQGRMVGNSVCPPMAAALVRANLGGAMLGERVA